MTMSAFSRMTLRTMFPRTITPARPRGTCQPKKLAGALSMIAALFVALPTLAAPPAPAPVETRAHVFTLEHRSATEAAALVRSMLTGRGTLEEQPRGNTLVVRDTPQVVSKVAAVLADFDQPLRDVRLDIKIVRAGPKTRSVVSPPVPVTGEDYVATLPPEQLAKLQKLLRYEEYRVLAEAGVTSRESESVTYTLGDDYDVSFKLGAVVGDRKIRLEGFRVEKRIASTNKARQLKPKELYHATFNLWLDRPFMLVLTQDESRQEALLIAISAHPEAATVE